MSAAPSLPNPAERSSLRAGIVKRVIQLAVAILVQAAILWAASGRLDWINAWVYIAFYVLMILINAVIILPRDPELIAERAGSAAGQKSWDRILIGLYGVFGLGVIAAAGLDRRWGEPAVPVWLVVTGTAAYLGGFALVSWAMASNHFFSSAVRIQTDRGHTVVRGGPYRFIRHPGYLGMLTSGLGIAVMLESYWALLPAVLLALVIIVRTALEDDTLQAELPGYSDYTAAVRYRLLPGLW